MPPNVTQNEAKRFIGTKLHKLYEHEPIILALAPDFNVDILKEKWLLQYMLGTLGMACLTLKWGCLPTTMRGTCNDLVFAISDQ